ncbi:MAG TPA: 2-phospho-L-lactate transferase [Candidatus Saccharimonadales bacterium]|nr:2-phospho-L-lactate transferase [Candidatus Saccharimonadales bacterium]
MTNKIVVLSGGVGGARFLEGLIQVVPQNEIVVIGNTGDDELFYGLHVSPDLDIVMYTLSGVVNVDQGWGLTDESYTVMEELTALGNESWFMLGDKDLATHIHRTQLLNQGKTLTEVTKNIAEHLGLALTILPMSNDRVPTIIRTPHGNIPFQEYFVKNRWKDEVLDIIYSKSKKAQPSPGILEAIRDAQAIIVTPSNPLVSIDTILSIPGIKDALKKTKANIAAISPIISGATIKGPADKMMKAMGIEVSAVGVAKHYRDFLDVMIVDNKDKKLIKEINSWGIKAIATDTIMKNKKIKKELASTVLHTLQS